MTIQRVQVAQAARELDRVVVQVVVVQVAVAQVRVGVVELPDPALNA